MNRDSESIVDSVGEYHKPGNLTFAEVMQFGTPISIAQPSKVKVSNTFTPLSEGTGSMMRLGKPLEGRMQIHSQ